MLEIGSLIDGKYKILAKIGQGGMSVVYLAMNEKANKQWAIKEVRKDGVLDFEAVKLGLVCEISMMKKFNHPNLPSIVDVIEDSTSFLIVMDYIQGNTLSRALEEYGAQPQETVIEWAKQLCDVLGYLHSRTPAIIYRDMKPANIMLKPDGNVTLIDFGTAREFKERNLEDTTCLGTVGYAAPEQFGGMGQTDARTDIYCLGATVYHLVTGHNPCEPPYEIRPIREINPSLSSGLERIIQKCTQRNPEDRYQSCAELMYALEHYEEIDDIYRKKQTKKLALFVAAAFLTVVFAVISGTGYVLAEEKKGQNYDGWLIEASRPEKTKEARTADYLEAIKTDSQDTTAYMEMLDLFLSEDEGKGAFSKEEASAITQLKAGMDYKNGSGFSSTLYPLEILKTNNPEGYAAVCYEIGIAYWYDYEIEAERYSVAVEWFEKAIDVYPLAGIYCEMGECYRQIKKYAGQNRTEQMYEEYQLLWEKLTELVQTVAESEENDTKILVWTEVVHITSEKAGYFIVTVTSEELIVLLDTLFTDAESLKLSTKYEDVKNMINGLQTKIADAKQRIAAVDN